MARPLIAIVGMCGSGKTTLARALQAHGFDARQVLQEHSYVPDMWRRITNPDVLIFLEASRETIRRRKGDPNWPDWLLDLEAERLRNAREHCDLLVDTDELTPHQVLARVLAFLASF